MSEKLPSGQSPVAVWRRLVELGCELIPCPGGKLSLDHPERCPAEFLRTLQESKPWLLVMLQWKFCMVYSQALEEFVCFAEDELTRDWLIDAGADPSSIYLEDELQLLLATHHESGISADELRRLHEIRKTFSATVTGVEPRAPTGTQLDFPSREQTNDQKIQ